MADGKRDYNFVFERKLMFLVGNIGSGKTTYINSLNGEYVTISRDKIRYMLGNGDYVFLDSLEPAVWEAENTLYANLLRTGVNIVIDEVNTNYLMRKRYLEEITFLPHEYEVTAAIFPILSKKVAVQRRMKNPHGLFTKQDWEFVFDKFAKRYSEPTIQEGFDKIVYLKDNGKGGFKAASVQL